ncbi:MAG: peptidoglycan recognition protein family protein [Filifactoraceae bacterium]
MEIKRVISKYNNSSRMGIPIKYLVLHDTGNSRSGAGALNHAKYFASGDRQSSAHYFVDDKIVVQLVEDSRAAWHCGDGRGRYGITNGNSIGIEICVNSDGNYEAALAKTKELIIYLLAKYKLPMESLVRHYDASRKICPASMHDNYWKRWYQLKLELGRR